MPTTDSSKTTQAEPIGASQTMQRIRVAVTGLAAVLLLIGLASAVFRYTSTEPAVTAVGAAKPDVVANIADAGVGVVNETSEPLAELGIAPGTTATAGGNTAVAK